MHQLFSRGCQAEAVRSHRGTLKIGPWGVALFTNLPVGTGSGSLPAVALRAGIGTKKLLWPHNSTFSRPNQTGLATISGAVTHCKVHKFSSTYVGSLVQRITLVVCAKYFKYFSSSNSRFSSSHSVKCFYDTAAGFFLRYCQCFDL